VPGGHTRIVCRLKGEASRLLNTLEGRFVQRRAQRDKIEEDFVELCQEGIEQVQGVHKRNSVLSSVRRRSVKEKTLTELLKYSG
jgi:hypothetical protein